LTTPSGPIALGRGHRTHGFHAVRVDEEGGVAIALSMRQGDCDSRDHYVLDVVDLRTRTVTRLLEGDGQLLAELGPDHALYVQTRADGLRRYADPRGDSFETLLDGIGLSSRPWDYNPYC